MDKLSAVPEQDREFTEFLIDYVQSIYAQTGEMHPIAMIDAPHGDIENEKKSVYESGGFDTTIQKVMFLNLVRFEAYKTGAERAGLAMESWMVTTRTDEEKQALKQVMESNISFSTLPFSYEAVAITVESDIGSTIVEMKIKRHHPTMVELEINDVTHVSYTNGEGPNGRMAGYYLRKDQLGDPENVEWIGRMEIETARLMAYQIKMEAENPQVSESEAKADADAQKAMRRMLN